MWECAFHPHLPHHHHTLSCGLGKCTWNQVRDSFLSGELHNGSDLAVSVWRCALQLAKRQTVSPGSQHLLQRLYHLPEAPGGASLLVSDQLWSSRRGPEQSCRGGEHGQDTVRGAECWNICHTHLAMFYLWGVITVRFRQTKLLHQFFLSLFSGRLPLHTSLF